MPTRLIRDGILTSLRVNQLDEPAENFFRRLLSVVDDFARYHAHPQLLRAACYPLRLDAVTDDDVLRWLAACERAGLLDLYEVAGKRYLELRDFRQQIRAKASKFPAADEQARSICIAHATQMLGTCAASAHLDVGVVEDVVSDASASSETNGSGEAPKPRQRETEHARTSGYDVIVAAYHDALPHCRRCNTHTDKRRHVLVKAERLARTACHDAGIAYDVAQFWPAYFARCALDPWMAGDVRNPNNPRWRQSLETLVDDQRFADVMDGVIGELREGIAHA